MVTLESIIEKLGYDPYYHSYDVKGYECDNVPSPFVGLTDEELDFVFNYCIEEAKKKKADKMMSVV